MKTKTATTIFSVILLMMTSSAYSMEQDGVEYPDAITVNGINLILNGLGTREATIFKVNVYVAALYLENPSSDGYAICESEETKRLILHFVRDVGGGDIGNAWTEGFMKNSGDDITVFQSRIETLNSWMSELKDGDQMMFTYIPDIGLEVSVKGTFMGTIEGSDFTGVFLSIWLGDDPPNGGLRDGLLGID
ncbi:MAG: chalcone isomerase family protein [Candidatus Aegiribacteria sp.]|nr:chalcone isomerase family protein [Candidatus Aegiribacteria sp.]